MRTQRVYAMHVVSLIIITIVLVSCQPEDSTSLEVEDVPENTQPPEVDEEEAVSEEPFEEEEPEENSSQKAEVTDTVLDHDIKTLDDYDEDTFRTLKQDSMQPRLFLGNEEVIGVQQHLGLFKYNLTAEEEIWRNEGFIDGEHAQIVDELLYIYKSSQLVSIDIHSGEVHQTYPIEKQYDTKPYIFEDYIVWFDQNVMEAYDIESAELIWEHPFGRINSGLAESDDAFFYESDMSLYAIEKDTGDVIWEVERPNTVTESSSKTKYPYVHEGSVFVQSYNHPDDEVVLIEVDASTGETLNEASFENSYMWYRQPLMTDDGLMISTDVEGDGDIVYIDFSMEEKWRFDHAGWTLVDYLYDDGMFYIIASKSEPGEVTIGDYHLIVLDTETGEAKDVIEIGDGLMDDQLYTQNGKVYIMIQQGDIQTFIYDYQGDTNRPFE
ncbi:outer membrane protein assembly factor BamB family protein [Alkalicoccobacillus porphyridii]|uniref:PQQ-like beta-propeller repeat protein n=1 Tax=Alkalicoccobacillus porphyridii TaxID=2597270 RepID=A0A554A142_9BACI|nr:PQQ-binding-like beta-propeller repeat protein [Alkalicoccobacillus porphyridii]TSB47395.1 PQQ-like beta-propeller repeat protein [Alkalicoccobacillus porphyridii]